MIERIDTRKTSELLSLLDYLSEREDYDFYFTKDNIRIYVTDLASTKYMLKDSILSYGYKNAKGDFKGIIVVSKSRGGEKERYYVKISAASDKIAHDLLTILTWNFNKELFIKVRKDSRFVEPLKFKGFRFIGGRGVQMLLRREPNKYEIKTYQKEADLE